MKKRLITASFLLIAILSFCQETYPKKIYIESDTVLAITDEQLIIINETFDELDYYKVKNDSLYIDLIIHKELIEKQLNINSILVSKNTEISIENDNLYRKDQINTDIIELYKKDLKHQKNKGMKLMIGGFTVGVTFGTILVLILNN